MVSSIPLQLGKKTFTLACGATIPDTRLAAHLLEFCIGWRFEERLVKPVTLKKHKRTKTRKPNDVLRALEQNYQHDAFARHVALVECEQDWKPPSEEICAKSLNLPPYVVLKSIILESREKHGWIHKGAKFAWLRKKPVLAAVLELDPEGAKKRELERIRRTQPKSKEENELDEE